MTPPLRRSLALACAMLGIAALSGCVAPVGPVEVTRFHAPETDVLGRGEISVVPARGEDGESLEFRSYAAAVARELVRIGYVEKATGSGSPQIAVVRVTRQIVEPGGARSPVSVGVGGSTGSYGSGVGVGIGFDLSPRPSEQIETTLAVVIRDRETRKSLWEGRASFTVTATSPLSNTQLGAPKLAEALFRGFPGESGETILVE
ncbi:MAG: DUF4136 domain-containing protein [Novosphingobium sp.]|nr:DUF4136 domain-containing protein [Novosphingobium sp.]